MPEPRTHVTSAAPLAEEPRLYHGGEFVTDPWRMLAGDEPVPSAGTFIVPLARWRTEPGIQQRHGPSGVLLTPPEMLETADGIDRLSLIVVRLAKFTDGRAYSTARRLRETLAYAGELRVTGDVLLDQLPLLARCGFDSFEIVNAPTVRALARGALPALSHVYQPPSGSRRLPLAADERMRRPA